MKERINKYNDFIHRNIFWITVAFAFWIAVVVVGIFHNTYIGNEQRHKIEDNTIQALRNHARLFSSDLKQDSIQNALRDKLDSINNYK